VEDPSSDKPKYITSASGHTAHPDDIIKSCTALQQHVAKSAEEAKRAIEDWEQTIKDRELAEKRRVAPGWLDREEKILEPTKAKPDNNLLDEEASNDVKAVPISPNREGEEIDRAFGSLAMK
jgi:hypothetical protein